MFEWFKRLFRKHSVTPADDALSIVSMCMTDIHNSLLEHLNQEWYRWENTQDVKELECLILSKFFMDYALLKQFSHKIEQARVHLYLLMLDTVFEAIFENILPELSYDDYKNYVANKLTAYSEILSNEPHPRCWQLIAGTCTGINYYREKDLITLQSASMMMPQIVSFAKNTLKLVIKE